MNYIGLIWNGLENDNTHLYQRYFLLLFAQRLYLQGHGSTLSYRKHQVLSNDQQYKPVKLCCLRCLYKPITHINNWNGWRNKRLNLLPISGGETHRPLNSHMTCKNLKHYLTKQEALDTKNKTKRNCIYKKEITSLFFTSHPNPTSKYLSLNPF